MPKVLNAFETIFLHSPDANFIVNNNNIIIESNPSAQKIFQANDISQLDSISLIELSPLNQTGAQDSYLKFEKIKCLAIDKSMHNFNWIFKKLDGKLFFADVTVTSIILEDKNHFHLYIKDISREKNRIDLMSYSQEISLKYMEKKINNLSDSLKFTSELAAKALNIEYLSIWTFNQDKDQLISYNQYQTSQDTYIHEDTISESTSTPYFKSVLNSKPLIIKDINSTPYKDTLPTSCMQTKDIKSIMHLPIIQKGEVIGSICFAATKYRRQWEQEEQDFAFSIAHVIALIYTDIEYSETRSKFKKISHILDNSQTIVFYWKAEPTWPVQYVTNNIQMFGYSQDDFYSGRVQYADIIHHHDLKHVMQEVQEYSSNGTKHFTQIYRIITADKQIRWIDDRTEIERDKDGTILYYFGTIIDITSQKEAEFLTQKMLKDNLNQEKVLAQQSKQASMGEMISNIAHQWRQPLSALSLMLQKLELLKKRETLTDKELSKTLSKGLLTIDKMSSTIDDFRNFFQPDKEKQEFLILSCIQEAEKLTSTLLSEHNIKLEIHIKPNLRIEGFKNELSQVILNIINNAKDACLENATKDPKIHIYSDESKNEIHIYIRNNGGNIDEDKISKIFEPYYSTKEEGTGTGIGLYMSKIIIQDHMLGTLNVQNINKGVEFKITFPKKSKSYKSSLMMA